ncbi:DegT/DnrJ/EryC1/StrS aminotransferase family protein [Pseudoalteromonas sp. J010]|uniref:DegT/DnrJ/EryC1/StrS family aminotransferase n=1 Tax=Pseudoalteromonas sp. J010 TaxID=998465 RepID=UPI000F64866B|nr:DegT/DnrJ/EryC1/StrS aminotransferase family protein [Pseudoalteromonas sp. J010]RRS09035.1 DegT/DnrJ/EryC1/StrS aminotransferase family protein [Pseudoalteromonas sp. J010]
MDKLAYTRPSITQEDVRLVTEAAADGWGERCYEYVDKFEKEFSEYIGVPYAMATSSCTGALHLGLSALGVGKGDEVILADTNWVATIAPILYLDATPVLVDVNRRSWCIDPNEVEKAITSKTRAIIATHLYGNLCELDELEDIAKRNGIYLIEDAAEAIGSEYNNKKAGSFGIFSVFSFHGTKAITTGEGGMLVSSDEKLVEKCRQLNNHGRAKNEQRQFWASELGYKYRMSNLQAALGVSQLKRVNEIVQRKREIFEHYKKLCMNIPDVVLNPENLNEVNSYWMPTLIFNTKDSFNIDELITHLQNNQIDARRFFWPLSEQPIVDNMQSGKNALYLSRRGLNLPSFVDMTFEQQAYVVDCICGYLTSKKVT